MIKPWKIAIVLSLGAGSALAGEVELWLIPPERPGNLADCRHYEDLQGQTWETPPPEAKRPDVAGRIHRDGLWLDFSATPEGVPARHLTDKCFVLRQDGKVLAGGALLSHYSARRLRFTTLVLTSRPNAEIVELELQPGFPAAVPLRNSRP